MMFSNLEIVFCVFLAENYFVKALIPLKGGTEKSPARLGQVKHLYSF